MTSSRPVGTTTTASSSARSSSLSTSLVTLHDLAPKNGRGLRRLPGQLLIARGDAVAAAFTGVLGHPQTQRRLLLEGTQGHPECAFKGGALCGQEGLGRPGVADPAAVTRATALDVGEHALAVRTAELG